MAESFAGGDPLAALAASVPDRIGVTVGPDTSLSYGALDRLAGAGARRLIDLGITAGDHIAMALPPGLEAVRLVHVAHRAGCVLVPIDPRVTRHERARYLERVEPTVLVTEPNCVDTIEETTDVTCLGTDRILVDASISEHVAHTWAGADPFVILATSGTTGRPKAVVLTVDNIESSTRASADRLDSRPSDRWMSPLAVHHMGGLAPVYRALYNGSRLVVPDEPGVDPARLGQLLQLTGSTGLSIVPTILDRLLETQWTCPSTLRTVLVGGGPIPASLIERAVTAAVPVCPTYGLTETASQVATAIPDEAATDPTTVGRPVRGAIVRLLDADGDVVPTGSVGEIVVDGPMVSPGYLDEESAAFGPDGFQTGDLGTFDTAGRLSITGRCSDRIVTGGENVDPTEVESVLCEHDAVVAAAVVGISDEYWGERVCAVIVVDDGLQIDHLNAHLVDYCRSRLRSFKVPKQIAVVDELPRTASGTVDRPALRALVRDIDEDDC